MPEPMVQDPMIGEALSLERLFLQNEEERLQYLLSYKAMMDDLTIDKAIRCTARAEGLAEGRAEGRAEGEAEGRADTVRRMLARGLSPEQIAEYTDLSLDEIKMIKARMSN